MYSGGGDRQHLTVLMHYLIYLPLERLVVVPGTGLVVGAQYTQTYKPHPSKESSSCGSHGSGATVHDFHLSHINSITTTTKKNPEQGIYTANVPHTHTLFQNTFLSEEIVSYFMFYCYGERPMTKATYRKNVSLGACLELKRFNPWSSWWEEDRHDARIVAEGLIYWSTGNRQADRQTDTGPAMGFLKLQSKT